MSQKIVIKTSVNKVAASPEPVMYQWHWRRIFTAFSVFTLLIVALVYGLMNSVNADDSASTNAPLSVSDAHVLAPVTQQQEAPVIEKEQVPLDVIPATPEQISTEVSPASQLVEPVAFETEDASEVSVEPVIEQLDTVADTEQALVQPAATLALDEVQSNELEEQVLEASQSDSVQTTQKRFSEQAKVANVALGAQIDIEHVSRAVLTTAISEREPVDVLKDTVEQTQFQEKLYFFTEIHQLSGETVVHLWFHQDQLMAEIPLAIKASRYRTYSSKNIMPSQTGQWRVEVVTKQGQLLAQKSFRIIPSAL